jgi:hypothetical protein
MDRHLECSRPVERMDCLADCGFEIIKGTEVIVVNRLGLEVPPVSLDTVEFWRIGGVPDRCQIFRVIGEKSAHDFGAVDRAVVEEEEDVTTAILLEQVLEERDELGAALAIGQQERHPTGQGIESPKDRGTAILTSRRDGALLADGRPHATQAGIEMELAFVLEYEGVAIGSGSGFFSATLRSRFARRTS